MKVYQAIVLAQEEPYLPMYSSTVFFSREKAVANAQVLLKAYREFNSLEDEYELDVLIDSMDLGDPENFKS